MVRKVAASRAASRSATVPGAESASDKRDSKRTCWSLATPGATMKTRMRTGAPSVAAKSTPAATVTTPTTKSFTFGGRQWGIATPSPKPVEPSFSRDRSPANTVSSLTPARAAEAEASLATNRSASSFEANDWSGTRHSSRRTSRRCIVYSPSTWSGPNLGTRTTLVRHRQYMSEADKSNCHGHRIGGFLPLWQGRDRVGAAGHCCKRPRRR